MIDVKIIKKSKRQGPGASVSGLGGYSSGADISGLQEEVGKISTLLSEITKYIHPYSNEAGALPWSANESDVDSIRVIKGVFSTDFLSCRGSDDSAGGSGGGSAYGLIRTWGLTDPGENTNDALGANLGWNLHARLSVVEDTYLSKSAAAASYQPKGDYLTDHQTIYGLTLQAGSFTAKTYNPKTGATTVNIPTSTSHIAEGSRLYFTDARAQSALSGHTSDSTIHITSAERTAWNAKLDKSVYDAFKSGYDVWKGTIDDFKSLFDSMFELEGSGSDRRIKAKFGLYTNEFLSVRGSDDAAGGSGSAYGLLKAWGSSDPGANTTDALGANLGWWLKTEVGKRALSTDLTALTTRVSSLEGGGFLTASALASYYTKTEADGKFALASSLGNYLPETGGTIKNGSTTLPLIIDTDSTVEGGIHFKMSGASKACVGYGYSSVGGTGAWLWNAACSKYLRLGDDGMPYVNKSKIWFEGNDGTGSGLDADLLDGWHREDVRARILGFEELRGSSTDIDLDTVLNIGGMVHNYGSPTYWVNGPSGMSYGTAIVFKPYNKISLCGMLAWDVNHKSTTDLTKNLYWRANATASDNTAQWGQWHQIAFTDSNVDSATKLQTARKIWGQDFDGTGNVNGHLSIGTIISQQTAGRAELSLVSATDVPCDLWLGVNGALKWSINVRGTSENNRLSIYNKSNGTHVFGILENGTVGIGTTSPDASVKLHVNGKVRIGSVVLEDDGNGNLKVSGGVWSTDFLSCRGKDDAAGGSGGTAYGLYSNWAQTPSVTDALRADLGKWLYDNKLTKTDAAGTYLSKTDAATFYQPKGNYLTEHQSLANYVTTNTEQSISAMKSFIGGLKIRYNADTSNALGIAWYTTGGATVKQSIVAHNIANRIILNPNGSASTYTDAVGKYSLIVGVDELTYNTKSILREDNYTSYVAKLGTSTVGSTSKPIYLNAGTPTALSATVGSSTKPVYLNAGTVTACSYTFGNGSGNAPISNGTVNTNLNADLLDGLHASSFPRVVQGSTSATGTKYILLGTLPASTTSTYDSFNIKGTIGSWQSDSKCEIDITVSRREGVKYNGFCSSLKASYWDIGVNAANQVFLILKTQYTEYNLALYAHQSAISFSTSTTPTDTNFVLLSASTTINKFNNGSFSGNADSATYATYLSAKDTPAGGSGFSWYAGQPTIGTAPGNAFKGSSDNINLFSFPDGGTGASATTANVMNLRLGFNATYWADIFASPNYERLWYRAVIGGTAKAWHKLAFYDEKIPECSLADEAKSLQTARKLWGVNFKGNADISGSMTVDGFLYDVKGILPKASSSAFVGSKAQPFWQMTLSSRLWFFRPDTPASQTVGNVANGELLQRGMFLDCYAHDYTPGLGDPDYPGTGLKVNGLIVTSCRNSSMIRNILYITHDGRVGILAQPGTDIQLDVSGTARISSALHLGSGSSIAKFNVVSGAVHCNVGFYSDDFISCRGSDSYSDMRRKRDVRDLKLSLEEIAAAPAITFRWKDTGRSYFGSSAQYWENVVPDSVREREGRKSLAYAHLGLDAAIIVARRVIKVEERVNLLMRKVIRLENENRELRMKLSKGDKYQV